MLGSGHRRRARRADDRRASSASGRRGSRSRRSGRPRRRRPGGHDSTGDGGKAFHWFDKPTALAEISRIVRPGGGLAFFWNVLDEERSTFVAEDHRIWTATAMAAGGKYRMPGPRPGTSPCSTRLPPPRIRGRLQCRIPHHECRDRERRPRLRLQRLVILRPDPAAAGALPDARRSNCWRDTESGPDDRFTSRIVVDCWTRTEEGDHDDRESPSGARPSDATTRADASGSGWEADDLYAADDDDPRPKYYPDDVPVPVGRPAHRPLVRDDAVRHRGPLSCACRATTSCSRWASTPLACPPRTRPSSAASIPCDVDADEHRPMRAPVAHAWARCSTGRARSSPAIPSTTSGTSGSSCSSTSTAWPTGAGAGQLVPRRQDARWRTSRSWARTGAASAAARRSSKRDLEQWFFRITATPTSC